ncbi:MAG: bifunctional 4-hydroxy-2-oxoglutarate aldolase/2-dehydro-3-deoxy-phosphogluconate aldolase, partial [Chloroflexota bacterium]
IDFEAADPLTCSLFAQKLILREDFKMLALLDQIERIGVMPVITIDRVEDALPLAKALQAGGIPCGEFTFRTPAAADAIRQVSAALPDFLVGAGTVLNVEQGKEAVSAGSRFIISPGFAPKLASYASSANRLYLPGVMTPTEIMAALDHGLTTLKFFPAKIAGGLPALKALAAPFPQVRFMPTGGVTIDNLADYLSHPSIVSCGGSWLTPKALIAEGQFDQITNLAAGARAIVDRMRS